MNTNENDCQKSECQMLGFLPPGGVLVLSPGQVAKTSRAAVVAMPIAELFMQHKSQPKATTGLERQDQISA